MCIKQGDRKRRSVKNNISTISTLTQTHPNPAPPIKPLALNAIHACYTLLKSLASSLNTLL